MRAVPLLALLAGCTTLGPMPTTTGLSAVPAGRPAGEVASGIQPIFWLSDGARADADADGKGTAFVSALFDPDRLLGIPGLFVAARLWGEHGDTGLEPQLGYRREIAGGTYLGGVVFGTRTSDDENGASYKATRFGGEAMIDRELIAIGEWVHLHVQGAVAAQYIHARGTFCYDTANGDARDCSQDEVIPMIDAKETGVFPSGTAQFALDIAHPGTRIFQHARVTGMLSAGWMPRTSNGMQIDGEHYVSAGVQLAVAFGAAQ